MLNEPLQHRTAAASGVTLHGYIPTVFPRLDPCTFWTLFHHKTLFVKAGFALWTAFTYVSLKRKDDVFLSAKLTDKTSGKTQLTVFHMSNGRLQHCFGLWQQLTLLHLL